MQYSRNATLFPCAPSHKGVFGFHTLIHWLDLFLFACVRPHSVTILVRLNKNSSEVPLSAFYRKLIQVTLFLIGNSGYSKSHSLQF